MFATIGQVKPLVCCLHNIGAAGESDVAVIRNSRIIIEAYILILFIFPPFFPI
jgi:hypothetical protein